MAGNPGHTLFELSDLCFNVMDARINAPTVHFELCFTRAAGLRYRRPAGKAQGPPADTRQIVFELSQLDLRLAFT